MTEMKNTQGVMINVDDDVKRFIGTDNTALVRIYKETYESIKMTIWQLAQQEELILQLKCMGEVENLNVKLSLLREYVYARCPFFRRSKSTKDIRVLIGRIDLLDPNTQEPTLNGLYKNKEVMQLAKTKLYKAMLEEYKGNISKYTIMYD